MENYIRTYYIVYRRNNGVSYRIITTPHNPDTYNGLMSLIQEIEGESGDTIIPLFWKKLDRVEIQ